MRSYIFNLADETLSPLGEALTLLGQDFHQAIKRDLRLSILGKTPVSKERFVYVLVPPKETLSSSGGKFNQVTRIAPEGDSDLNYEV